MRVKKNRRDISGILLLDKKEDMSSSQALVITRAIMAAQKAGHTGSLDPAACGLLPICFGEAAKFSCFFLDGNKKYIATGTLGITTTSGDREGDVVIKRDVGNAMDSLYEVIEQFKGTITQVPPIYSAIKVNGKALYKYARAGVEVEIPKRQVTIFDIKVLDIKDDTFTVEVTCSKGTYIRTLIQDIGEALGCGAYVSYLRRSGVEGLPEGPLYSIDDLQAIKDSRSDIDDFSKLDELLLPLELCVASLPVVNLPYAMAEPLTHGVRQGRDFDGCDFDKSLIAKEEENVQIRCNGRFLGVGYFKKGMLIPRRMMSNLDF